MIHRLAAYIPQDRRLALAGQFDLPDRAYGAVLFADISGFTPLTEALSRSFGSRRGAEVLTAQISQVYEVLIAEIDRYGGSVISFAGDAVTCWFDNDQQAVGPQGLSSTTIVERSVGTSVRRATACAQALQVAMRGVAAIPISEQETVTLALKVAVATGAARRFVVGDPAIKLIDTLAGITIDRVAAGEHLAKPGDIILDRASVEALGPLATIAEWRADDLHGDQFAVLASLTSEVPTQPWLIPDYQQLTDEQLRPWILPAIYEREQSDVGDFFTELRPAAALFLRFVGFVYERDDAGAQLDALVRVTQQVVERYAGTVMQLTIGDKGAYIYAAFGAPIAHEDDARRAVYAAIDIRQAVAALGVVAPLQIGVSFGTMRAGPFGASTCKTYGVIGDDVNLAARLMQFAAPGEIVLSGRVQQDVATDFATTPRPPVLLKGKANPVPIFELVGVRQQRALRLEAPTYALPMIGRQRELTQILEQLEYARTGSGRIVAVEAEAGLGKSRLVAEVIRGAVRRGLECYGGAARADGITAPYLVWGPIWQALFGDDALAPYGQRVLALEAQITRWAPTRLAALPLVGALFAIDIPENEFTRTLEPRDRQGALHALLLECLTAVAQARGGLLIALEDLHWIDAASELLLEHVARAIVDLPICIVLAHRPLEPKQHSLIALMQLDNALTVHLDELDQPESEQLIRSKVLQLFPDEDLVVPDTLIEQLSTRAQGNPFYLEELLNYLRDLGLTPTTQLNLAMLELPTSLHSLVLSRIDHLSARQQLVLKVASVLGRRFGFQMFQQVYPASDASEILHRELETLSHADLTPLDTPEPELAYLFKHIVTQEAAYESLTYATRAVLHEQVGDYIERTIGELGAGSVDLLAYHYFLSNNLPKKRHYLRRAGEAAAARYANLAALEYLNRALALVPTDDVLDQYLLLAQREQVFALQGAREEQASDLAHLAELAIQLGNPVQQAEVAVRQANYAYLIGDYEQAISAAMHAVALAEAAQMPAVAAHAQQEWAWALIGQGNYVAAREQATRCLQLSQAAGDQRITGRAYQALGEIAGYQGDHAAEYAFYQDGLAITHTIGDRRTEGNLLNNLGVAAVEQGDYAAARTFQEQNLRITNEIGNRRGQGFALGNLGDVAARQGDYQAAQEYLEQCLRIMRAVGSRQGEAIALWNLSKVACLQGDYPPAERFARDSLAIAQQIGDQYSVAGAQMALGDVLLRLGRIPEAEQACSAAFEVRQVMNQQHLADEAQAGLARVDLARGDPNAARERLTVLIDYILQGGTLEGVEDLLLILLTCCEVLQATGDTRTVPMVELSYQELMKRAHTIPDAPTRERFLTQVPYHQAILRAQANGRPGS